MLWQLPQTDFLSFLWKLLLALLVAAPIGIEREKAKKFAGMRTSLMVASLGFFSSLFAGLLASPWIVGLGLFFSISVALIMYYARSRRERHPGLTTSTVFVLVFCLGVLVERGLLLEAVSASIILTLLLSVKLFTKALVENLTERELVEALALGFVSFIILPLLPNRAVDPWGLFNPFLVWSMTLLVLALGFAGYAATRIFGGKAGIGLVGLLGGLVSTFAVIFSLSPEARRSRKHEGGAALAIALAFTMTFLRTLLLVLVGSGEVFAYLAFPLLAGAGASFFFSSELLGSFKSRVPFDFRHASPFSFRTAVRFSVLFAAFLIAFRAVSGIFGTFGIYITSLVAGFGGLSALVVSVISLASGGLLTAKQASIAILLGLASTGIVDFFVAAKLGGRGLAGKTAKMFAAGVLVSAAFIAGLLLLG